MNNFLLIGDACENLRPFIKIVKKDLEIFIINPSYFSAISVK